MNLLPEFAQSFGKFREYACSEKGRAHLSTYADQRRVGQNNFRDVCAAVDREEDVTWVVLTKLLPHQNTIHNREKGAWVHVAPAITRDIRSWFENVGWAKPDDWPKIADGVLRFFRTVAENPDMLQEACQRFGRLSESKGIQSAFLSPMLNALFPDRFAIANKKTFETLKAVAGVRHQRKIMLYPLANETIEQVVLASQPFLTEFAAGSVLPGDVFDAFCHWYVAIYKDWQDDSDDEIKSEPIDRSNPDSARAWFHRFVPEESREQCERLLGDLIELANTNGQGCWELTLGRRRLRLNVGALRAMELAKDGVRIGLVRDGGGVLPTRLESEGEWRKAYSTKPQTALYATSYQAFSSLEPALRQNLEEFIGIASTTARRSPYFASHSPGVVEHLSTSLGRVLPSPMYGDAPDGDFEPPVVLLPPAVPLKHPRTLFKKVDYELANLLNYIDLGDIGLPDLQRPFVWSTTKVRDLFDSMYRGYPIGYLLFWSNAALRRQRQIGGDPKAHEVPSLLIVDGQQRLTSLYGVFRGVSVLDEDFSKRQIEIAFRPRDGRFEVTDAAIRKDPEFIANISELWASGKPSWILINRFFEQIEAKRTITADDKEAMSHNLDRLFDLQKYPFSALEIVSDVQEESVAEIFVRINSEGVKLNQADFILTLLSVFWPEGRKQLEQFAHDATKVPGSRPSPFNHLIQPAPDQLLRVAIGVAFFRARLKSVYQILRAKDVYGIETSEVRREELFGRLKDAQEAVLDLHNWHQFLKGIMAAGFRSADMISSDVALTYSYVLFLIGRRQCGVPEHQLQRLVARWFIGSILTGRYTGSGETIMEEDLAPLKECQSAEQFVAFLDSRLNAALTKDFWTVTLPIDLETSSAKNPALLAFYAAQVKLNAPALFSDKPVSQLLDPSLRPPKSSIDRHHLFPRKHLEKSGITDRKQVNQTANFSLVEWPDNLSIGASAPKQYVEKLRPRFSEAKWQHMCRVHALPPNWHEMEYAQFLKHRRVLMAGIIRQGYDAVCGENEPDPVEGGTAAERQVWDLIRQVETTLRRVVQQKYERRWGQGADKKMRSLFGSEACQVIDKNRAKHQAQYGNAQESSQTNGLLDYAYLGQLILLMVAGDAWELFRDGFKDKRELEDLGQAITPVRNDGAHFRAVPEIELMRCRVAATDLLSRVTK